MDAPLALYRRYRPRTFDEVIGQEHVTVPLQQALANNRVHHAYLFSGPRGCGKTTSARILARELNGLGPDDADDGMDIIEIDAASHGGVDDARDLRERAFFAPVNSQYKIYIIDEAHMVSNQGFNALLKLVEEPPPHLKFIFATTEPDKVIGTIRSRTHHYPFRLVPPKLLSDYVQTIAQKEGVAIEPTALPMIVRAGGGSVRDTLSVLDQLLAGSGPDGVTYQLTTALLGYTPEGMLDELVDAIAARDGSTVFSIVDRVIESGQDPRRFTEDLLHRLRDLVIAAAVKGDAAVDVLDRPADRVEALRAQASRFGPAEITRGADIVNVALREFRGATAPRILLELMCMRILLPGSDDSTEGIHARLDRLERRLSIGTSPEPRLEPSATSEMAPPATAGTEPRPPAGPRSQVDPLPAQPEPLEARDASALPPYPDPPQPAPSSQNLPPVEAESAPPEPEPEPEPELERVPEEAAIQTVEPAEPEESGIGDVTILDVRRLWSEILETVKDLRRFTWIMLSQHAQVTALDGDLLTVALANAGARESFLRSGNDEILAQGLHQVLGVSWRIKVDVQGESDGSAHASRHAPEPSSLAPSESAAAARENIRPTRGADLPSIAQTEAVEADGAAADDDPVIEEDIDHEALLKRELGAQVIEEHDDD